MRRAFLFWLGLILPLHAETLKDLPQWTQGPLQAVERVQAPGDADAWVIFKRLEFSYGGRGEVRIMERSICRVISDEGARAGQFVRASALRRAGIRRLKGWNLRPDGTLTRVDRGDLIGLDGDSGDEVSNTNIQALALHAVVKGSVVVYESEQVLPTITPSFSAPLFGPYPTHTLEIHAKGPGAILHRDVSARLSLRNAQPWLPPLPSGNGDLRFSNLPAIPEREAWHPAWQACLPQVHVVFEDPGLSGLPEAGSWDALARWYSSQVAKLPGMDGPVGKPPADPSAAIRQLHEWLLKEFRYQQVYLSPSRGWIPEKPAEIIRKRYGDCKDLAICFLTSAAPQGIQGYPVLARVLDAPIRGDEPASASAFNHLLTAIRLERSLGLPAEVETEAGRLLLVDCTARFTPLGWLPEAHRKGRVMVCTPQRAVWVDIPDTAVEPSSIRISVKGDLTPGGFQGSIELLETGNDRGLRSSALLGDARTLLERVTALMGLSATTKLSISGQGDPLDLSRPFKVTCALTTPTPLRRMGREFELMDLGFPPTPGLIQPKGKARVLPVEYRSHEDWHLSLDLGLGGLHLAPSGSGRSIETPFRRIQWTSQVGDGRLRLEFKQRTRDAFWGFTEREEGVAAQRKDRATMRLIMEDARALLPQQ